MEQLTVEEAQRRLPELLKRAAAGERVTIDDQGETLEIIAGSRDHGAEPAPRSEAKNLFELFAPVRGLLTDEEVDTLFSRNRSHARPVDLE